MPPHKSQRVRDPLHDLIEFEAEHFENKMWATIETPPFQRLRRVKQLGFSELTYPGATHSRFAHSIGVFHTAKKLIKNMKSQLDAEKRYNPARANVALAAALVHDVGHGPFSHSFEAVGKILGISSLKHERTSARIIRETEVSEALDSAVSSGFSNDVATLIENDGPTDIYSAVVSSQFDADRLDYMRRDRLMTGTQHSEIDFTWLVSNLRIGNVTHGVDEAEVGEMETLVLDSKAIFAAETYVLGLFQLYPTVYFHKATRSAEKIFIELLLRIFELSRNSDHVSCGLPENHPLIMFGKDPEDLNLFLALDDSVIWGALSQMSMSTDPIIEEYSSRLRERRLLKSIDVSHVIKKKVKVNQSHEGLIDKISLKVLAKAEIWNEDKSTGASRVIIDKAERTPYKKFSESPSGLNQMFIYTKEGLKDLADVSDVVRAAKEFRLRRLYFREEDNDAEKAINDMIAVAIREECKDVA